MRFGLMRALLEHPCNSGKDAAGGFWSLQMASVASLEAKGELLRLVASTPAVVASSPWRLLAAIQEGPPSSGGYPMALMASCPRQRGRRRGVGQANRRGQLASPGPFCSPDPGPQGKSRRRAASHRVDFGAVNSTNVLSLVQGGVCSFQPQ